MLTEADGNRDDGDELTCQEALTQIVHEDDLSEVPEHLGSLYGYPLEATCGYLGKHVGEMQGNWGELDAFFAERKVPLTFSSIAYGDSVLAIPEPEFHPLIGSWKPSEVARRWPVTGARSRGARRPRVGRGGARGAKVARGGGEALRLGGRRVLDHPRPSGRGRSNCHETA